MQRPLVGESEPAQRGELLFVEVFPIVGKDKFAVIDYNGCFCCASVIRVLQKFRYNMTGNLDLPEQLMPRAGQFRFALELIP